MQPEGEECPVPRPQQPMFELKQLQEDSLFKWAEKPAPEFVARLAIVYAGVLTLANMVLSLCEHE